MDSARRIQRDSVPLDMKLSNRTGGDERILNNKGLIITVIVVILLVGGYFLFAGKMTQAPAPSVAEPEDVSEPTQEESSMPQEGDITEITVEGDEYSFSPEALTLTSGQKVRLTFKNVGSQPHNFVIDDLGVASKTIPGGGSDTVEFTANESGSFGFYCGVGNHEALGMEGDLEVE